MQPELHRCYELLPRVSRTFALNIRILPGELRPATTIAYLLFRFVDTIEDAPGLCEEDRSALFDAALDRLDGSGTLALPETARVHLSETVSADEAELLRAGEEVFRAHDALPPDVRDIIASHVSETARGMQRISATMRRDGLLVLDTWKDLDEYCYYVAGTIGIMLTRLFAAHSRHLDRQSERQLMALGTNFGRGLQLTNILKGVFADRREGRVFLPSELLARHGVTAEGLPDEGARHATLAAVNELVPRALLDLEDALRYTLLVPRREPRIRLFCLWPLFTAVRTLSTISRGCGILPGAAPARIGRGELYREMATSAAEVFSNGRLRRRFDRFRRELFPPQSRREVWAGP